MYNPTIRFTITRLAVLALLCLLPLFVSAQENTSPDSSTSIEANATQEANYNNSRSNRANISVSEDTNVCDGVTCPDGSCADTAAACGIEETVSGSAADVQARCEADGSCRVVAEAVCTDGVCQVITEVCADGRCVARENVCQDGSCTRLSHVCGDRCGTEDYERVGYNNSRSNRSTIRSSDAEVDAGPTPTDRAIREGGQTVDAGTAPERGHVPTDTDGDGMPDLMRDEDSDGDGISDGTERAQNHNSSRSNRTEGIAVDWQDPDDDGDGVPDATMRAGGFMKIGGVEGEANSRVSSGEVICWGRAEDEDGTVYSWGRGLCVAAQVTADAEGVASDRIAALQIRGDEVRGWSEAERDAWREYVTTRATTSPEERVAAHAIEQTQANERIEEITNDDENINLRYRSQLRLFGFIPMEREVEARVDAAGEVVIDYPWYSVLSRTPDTSTIRELMSSLVNVGGGGGGRVSL